MLMLSAGVFYEWMGGCGLSGSCSLRPLSLALLVSWAECVTTRGSVSVMFRLSSCEHLSRPGRFEAAARITISLEPSNHSTDLNSTTSGPFVVIMILDTWFSKVLSEEIWDSERVLFYIILRSRWVEFLLKHANSKRIRMELFSVSSAFQMK